MKKFVTIDTHILKNDTFENEQRIFKENGVEYVLAQCKNDEEVLEVAKDADGIALIYYDMHKGLIDQLENCKVIVRYGIGYDTIDVKAATEKGIIVCNIPDYCQEEVASHTMAMLLDLSRKITLLDKSVRKGLWDSNYGYPINRIDILTLGMIGFGSIGRMFVKYMSGFETKLIAYDPYVDDSEMKKLGVEKVELDKLYENADVIAIFTPLTPETEFMINEKSISKMKKGVLIVNTSRGPIIKLKDLLNALETGKVKAAALDVVETEPITDKDDEIYDYENLIVTPHSAYNSVEAANELHQKVAYTGVEVLVKENMPYNAINKRELDKDYERRR